MTSSDLVAYRLEIMNFLQSLTIKYTPISDTMNINVQMLGKTVDISDPKSWKYYMNLTGQYHETDTLMYVYSLDTQESIPFTREMLAIHTKTASKYRPGNTEYTDLCAKYPEQVDLIKSIVYPVNDINEAILADDLTILSYGYGFLESAELPIILDDLARHLKYIRTRFYHDFLKYEEYFYVAFWGCLWPSLLSVIYATRVKNIHTAYAHTFHIWEYLSSNGIGDYRDILTRRQSLFLYRNMSYLQANRGKKSNLIILADNLLKEISVGMVGKTIYQQTIDGVDECRWIPEFVSEPVPTQYADILSAQPTETMTTTTYKLYQAGYETDTSTLYIDEQTRKIGSTIYNTLPTKLLEIQPLPIDKKYSDTLNNFILDTLVRLIQDDKYVATYNFVDSVTGVKLNLTTKDALILYYLCVHKQKGYTPINLPNKYTPNATFKYVIDKDSLPKSITFQGHSYPLTQLFDVDAFVEGITYPISKVMSSAEFDDLLGSLFSRLVYQIIISRKENHHVAQLAIHEIFNAITDRVTYTLTLAEESTYAEWLSKRGYNQLTTVYDASENHKALYADLSSILCEYLVPMDTDILKSYADIETKQEFYGRLKELFTQLCSYNVLFLDTPKTAQHWFFFSKIGSYIYDLPITRSGLMELDSDVAIIPHKSAEHTVPFSETTHGESYDLVYDHQTKETQHIDISNDVTQSLDVNLSMKVGVNPSNRQHVIKVPSGISMSFDLSSYSAS